MILRGSSRFVRFLSLQPILPLSERLPKAPATISPALRKRQIIQESRAPRGAQNKSAAQQMHHFPFECAMFRAMLTDFDDKRALFDCLRPAVEEGNAAACIEVLTRFKREGRIARTAVYNMAIAAALLQKAPALAIRLREEMKALDIRPDERTYFHYLGLAKHFDLDWVFALLREYQANGFTINSQILFAVMRACWNLGHPEQVFSLFKEAKLEGMEIDSKAKSLMALVLATDGDAREALAFFDAEYASLVGNENSDYHNSNNNRHSSGASSVEEGERERRGGVAKDEMEQGGGGEIGVASRREKELTKRTVGHMLFLAGLIASYRCGEVEKAREIWTTTARRMAGVFSTGDILRILTALDHCFKSDSNRILEELFFFVNNCNRHFTTPAIRGIWFAVQQRPELKDISPKLRDEMVTIAREKHLPQLEISLLK